MLKSHLFILLVFLSSFCSAQTANFLKTFTPTPAYTSTANYVITNMWPQGIATLSPSSFIVGGFYSRYYTPLPGDTATEDSYLIKNHADGLTKWFRKYHLPKKRMIFYDVAIKNDGDILAVGTSNDLSNQQNPDGIFLRTDSNGYLKSLRIFPSQSISKITVLKDKKIALLATDINEYLMLILLDQNCNLLWAKKLMPSTNNDKIRGYELIEGNNKSLIIVGDKTSSTWYPFALSCDSLGNKIADFTLPTGASFFLNAGNNFDNGFYIIGAGVNYSSNTLNGYLLKVDNQLQIHWFKIYECNITHVEFTDLIIYDRNNISVLTEPESSTGGSRRAGFTFIDSIGSIRKSHLFNTINTDQYPDKMLPIQNGKVLFTLHSNAGRLFGITDTIQSGFCNSDTLTWLIRTSSVTAQYNNVNLINSQFNYVNDTAYLYTPKDAELQYICSTGPTGPLDTINYPPPPPPPPPSTLTSGYTFFDNSEKDGRFVIQPNPVANHLTITTNRPPKSPIELLIINSEGKVMLSKKLFNFIFPFTLEVSDFPIGLYILSIKSSDNKIYNLKFVVTRE